jgi:hypothetical protein
MVTKPVSVKNSVTVTKPVSVMCNGNVNKKTNDVTVERNGPRNRNR